eukprot:866537-Prymnesium_polylepis.1
MYLTSELCVNAMLDCLKLLHGQVWVVVRVDSEQLVNFAFEVKCEPTPLTSHGGGHGLPLLRPMSFNHIKRLRGYSEQTSGVHDTPLLTESSRGWANFDLSSES